MDGRVQMEAILRALVSRGWCFRDVDDTIDTLMGTITTAADDRAVEAELVNMDLREIGGRSLPDSSVLKKSSYLPGPKVLQVVSVRDVHQCSIEVSFKSSRRLLMFCLTDGYSDVIAIEYAPILSITEEIIPGTKVRLEVKTPIHSGILCLESKTIIVLGGLVQSLYEEWQISRKYSGFSRSHLKLSQNSDSVRPPPFEKLQIGSHPQGCKPQSSSSELISKTMVQPNVQLRSDAMRTRATQGQQRSRETHGSDANVQSHSCRTESSSERAEDKPTCSSSRPKEISDAVPVQNQAAAQKLLQRMNKPNRDERPPLHGRGTRQRGKGKAEEPVVFTLDEWERRKSTAGTSNKFKIDVDISRDEEVARQLQKQLDLEDQNFVACHESETDKIRTSMFNFGRERQTEGRRVFRGRGRGKSRFT